MDDLISLQDAIKAIDEKAKRIKNEDTLNGLAGAIAILFDLPPVNQQEPCEDAISRQAVLDLCDKRTRYDIPYEYYEGKKHIRGWDIGRIINMNKLIELPSVKPQPKTGHCKDCKHFHKLPYHADALGKCIHHGGFCPKGDWYCADFEPQERSDKE